MKDKMDRRNFIKASAIGIAGAGIASKGSLLKAEESVDNTPELKIKEYRTLGRTGFKVSDISSGYSDNPTVLGNAFDAGLNYVDTAESYKNQPSVGKAIKGRDRKKIFITSKLEITKEKGLAKEDFVKRFHKCLEELDTPYIDCMMIHSCEEIETMKTKGFHLAMDQMKAEGKLRFVGISNHGSTYPTKGDNTMEKTLLAAVEDGRFDVMLLAYNFLLLNHGDKVLRACKEKNIGTTLMKVNPVGNYLGMKERIEKMDAEKKKVSKEYRDIMASLKEKADLAESFIKKYNLTNKKEITDAAIKYCLSNSDVNTVCCAMRNFEHLDAYIPLSGTKLTTPEKKKLAAYKEGCSSLYCKHACGECEPSCPNDVPVNTIMRYHHYYDAHGREKHAIKQYAALTKANASGCESCEGFCEKSCPHNVPIQGLLNMAHWRLTV